MSGAVEARGEAAITVAGIEQVLRPTFAALTKVEQEIGSLFGFVERTVAANVTLAEIATLFWHCLTDEETLPTREQIGEAIVEAGLSAVTPILKALITQILKGR